jgi:hypothetical protein
MIKPAYEQLGGRTSAIPLPVRPASYAFQGEVSDRSSRHLLAVSCSVVSSPKGQARRGRKSAEWTGAAVFCSSCEFFSAHLSMGKNYGKRINETHCSVRSLRQLLRTYILLTKHNRLIGFGRYNFKVHVCMAKVSVHCSKT